MNSQDRVLLEQAYLNMYEDASAPCPCESGEKCTKEDCKCEKCKESKQDLHEDVHDAPQDAALERSIRDILLGAFRRDELNEYSLHRGPVVGEIMQAVQQHTQATQ